MFFLLDNPNITLLCLIPVSFVYVDTYLNFLPFRTSPSCRKLQLLSSDFFSRCSSARSGLQTRGLLPNDTKISYQYDSSHSSACFTVYFPDLEHYYGGHASIAGHVPNT